MLSSSAPDATAFVSFENILDQLERLGRDHLLFYRVQVGELLLGHFWRGDAAVFSSPSRYKDGRFDLFFEKCGDELARYGLSKNQARNSIRASIVVRTLPKVLAERLFLSQVLELVRLRDPTQRARLAQAALASDWSVQELRRAVTAVRAGLPLDGDATTPGVQLPDADAVKAATRRRLSPGRLVTRAEKLAGELETWAGQWRDVDLARVDGARRARLVAAVAALEAQVVALKVGLGDSDLDLGAGAGGGGGG